MSWQPPQQQHTQARIPPAQVVDLLDLSDPAPAPAAVPVDGDVFGMFGAPAPAPQKKKPPPSSPPSSSLLQRIQARKGEQTPPKKAPPPPPQQQQPQPTPPQPQPHTQVRMPPPLTQPQQLPQIHQKAPQAQAQPQLKKPPPYSQPQQQQTQLKNPTPQQAPQPQNQTPNTQKQYAMVFLHVYDLQPDPVQHQQQTQQPLTLADRALLGLSNVLPTLGMGLYHTSLEVMGHKYTFVGNAGVVVGSATGPDLGLPQGARFKEKIPLGPTFRTPQEAKEILTTLATLFFTPNAYDVMHRNCNHFTETGAMALILNEPPPHENASLLSYPKWLNRLAQTGAWAVTTAVGGPGAPNPEKGSPCNILQEATLAAGF